MSARRRWTRCRASLRRMPSRSARSRSVGRLAKSSSSRLSSERNASSLPLCGVAVTRTRCRDLSSAISPQQLEALLAPAPDAAGQRAAVGLVHDDELGALEDEVLGAARRLDEVGGDDGEAVAVEDRDAQRQVALQALDRAAQHQLGLDVELLGQLALPLLGQVRRAEHGHPSDLAAVEQFAGDDGRFDGLADADIVGDQQAHGVELERHHQRHELVGPRLDGDAAEAAERAGGGAGGQARRVAQELARGEVAEVVARGQPEGGGLDRLHRRQDAGDLLVEPAHRAHHQQLVGGVGQHDPFAAARMDQGAGFGESGGAHALGRPEDVRWRRKISLQSALWWKRITM